MTGMPIDEGGGEHPFMRQALALAAQAIGLSEPNPRVGCVITTPEGRVIGQGHTQQAGGPHAEVMALRDAQAHGESVRGATAHVTLEPCSHHGRTPPCCDALIEAGLRRVVVALGDPNPLVAGQGLARLRAAGLVVDALPPGPCTVAAHELNIGFYSRMQRQRPWVRLKVAVSLDGRTALSNGVSQWITGEAARADGHAWRRRAGAVLTGVGTVRSDDPRLDVRLVPTVVQPLRVVVDARLETSPQARLLDAPGAALFYAVDVPPPGLTRHAATLPGDPGDDLAALPADAAVPWADRLSRQRAALEARGAEVVSIGSAPSAAHHVDLGAMLADLARRGVNELHVEAGQRLNGAFIREGWVDEYLVYVAPLLLGSGRDLSDLGPLTRLQDGVHLRYQSVTPVGDDLRILARVR